MSRVLKILGVDPSLSNFGIAHATFDIDTLSITVDDFSIIQSQPEKDKKTAKVVRKNSEDLERAKLLHQGFIEASRGRSMAFIEIPVGSQSARAMASYGVCIGVLSACPIPMIQVTAGEVKKAGAGVKTATKEEMIESMMAKYPTAPWPMQTIKGVSSPIASKCEHLADALAAIEAGMQTDEFRRLIAMYRSVTPTAA